MYNIHNTYILHNTIGVETFKIKVYKLELAPTIALAMAVQATSASRSSMFAATCNEKKKIRFT